MNYIYTATESFNDNFEENDKNTSVGSSQNHNNFERVNSPKKFDTCAPPNSNATLGPSTLTRKRNSRSGSGGVLLTTDELLEIKEMLQRISRDVVELQERVQDLHEEMTSRAPASLSSSVVVSEDLKPALKKVTFVETAHTIDELIKFKMECKNRVYDVIYNSRGQKTVSGPGYVDEERIIKLSNREKARIYVPGKPQPLQVISEIATAVLKIGALTFTIETALHQERNTPVVLGKEFGKKFIVSVNTEHKILTLKDDNGVPCAITYELFLES